MTIPIIVVDDEETDRYLVKRVIKSLAIDAKLVEYDDGSAFVEVIRDIERKNAEIGSPPPPALVLLDINMPRMNGFEVLEEMNAILGDTETVMLVTMYSSSNHAEDRADAEKYSFVKDYIVKPITAGKLQKLLDTFYLTE